MKLSIGLHVIVGLAFAGLVIVNLRQRKNRIRGLMAHFKTAANWAHHGGRLAWSDLILFFISLNLIVSGIADYLKGGRGIFINIGLPKEIRWHSPWAILVLVYLLIHVGRRMKRFRNSRVT